MVNQLENLEFLMKFQSDSSVEKYIKPFTTQDWINIQRPPIGNYIPQQIIYEL